MLDDDFGKLIWISYHFHCQKISNNSQLMYHPLCDRPTTPLATDLPPLSRLTHHPSRDWPTTSLLVPHMDLTLCWAKREEKRQIHVGYHMDLFCTKKSLFHVVPHMELSLFHVGDHMKWRLFSAKLVHVVPHMELSLSWAKIERGKASNPCAVPHRFVTIYWKLTKSI